MDDLSFQIVNWSKRAETNKTESQKSSDANEFKGACLWDCIKNMGSSRGKEFSDKEILMAVKELAKDNNIEDPNKLKTGQEIKVEADVMEILGFEKSSASEETVKEDEKTQAQSSFSDFSNSMDKTEFKFVEDASTIKSSDDYSKALLPASKEALKGYDANQDGTVTQQEIIDNQAQVFEKGLDILKQENLASIKEMDEMIEESRALGFDTTALEELRNQQIKEQNELLKSHKASFEESLPVFAKNFASLDGDASSISQKDIATYLMAADAQDLNEKGESFVDGKITKENEELIARTIENKGPEEFNNLSKIIDELFQK